MGISSLWISGKPKFPSFGRLQFPEAHDGDGIPWLCTQGISRWDANPERTKLTKGFLMLGAAANYAESYNFRFKRAFSEEILGATDP